jgi:hypothetical protein
VIEITFRGFLEIERCDAYAATKLTFVENSYLIVTNIDIRDAPQNPRHTLSPEQDGML